MGVAEFGTKFPQLFPSIDMWKIFNHTLLCGASGWYTDNSLKKIKNFFQVDDLRLCIYRNHKKIILARLDGDSDGGDVGVPIGKSQNRVKWLLLKIISYWPLQHLQRLVPLIFIYFIILSIFLQVLHCLFLC